MREEPAARQLRKTPVKTCVGPRGKDVNQSLARKTKSQQTSRDVDPVRPSKRFDERARATSISRELVMLVDHRGNLWCPRCSVDAHDVRVRKPDRRRQIVERAVRPDSQIVKRRGDGAFGRRVLIQPVMSAITFSLSMSLSRSCAGHPRRRGNPASSRVARCAGFRAS